MTIEMVFLCIACYIQYIHALKLYVNFPFQWTFKSYTFWSSVNVDTVLLYSSDWSELMTRVAGHQLHINGEIIYGEIQGEPKWRAVLLYV